MWPVQKISPTHSTKFYFSKHKKKEIATAKLLNNSTDSFEKIFSVILNETIEDNNKKMVKK